MAKSGKLAPATDQHTMARKVFQDFAHVLCQKFIEVPFNTDLVNLVIFGDGTLQLDLLAGKAIHNRAPIAPLAYMKALRAWLESRLAELEVPPQEMTAALLAVDYTVHLHRRPSLNWLCAEFKFECTGIIRAPDREYESSMRATRDWGLGQLVE
jgi:hypothetical protein